MYTILVNYRADNGFGSEDREEEIGLVWEDKDLARRCLQAIKEHHDFYREIDTGHSGRTEDEIAKDVKKTYWFHQAEEYTDESAMWHLNYEGCFAEMDDGYWEQVPTSMWCRGIESLYGARIISTTDDEDSFTV